ncbi:hypothetical protein BC827DRAFT_808317 [Russula dissimulans]|nr:hypothetical protein BC827DRAFT_808317 [Russula dissimulans]
MVTSMIFDFASEPSCKRAKIAQSTTHGHHHPSQRRDDATPEQPTSDADDLINDRSLATASSVPEGGVKKERKKRRVIGYRDFYGHKLFGDNGDHHHRHQGSVALLHLPKNLGARSNATRRANNRGAFETPRPRAPRTEYPNVLTRRWRRRCGAQLAAAHSSRDCFCISNASHKFLFFLKMKSSYARVEAGVWERERGVCEISDSLMIYPQVPRRRICRLTTTTHLRPGSVRMRDWGPAPSVRWDRSSLKALQNDEVPRHARRTRKLLCLVGSRESFYRLMQALDSGCRSGKGARGEGR